MSETTCKESYSEWLGKQPDEFQRDVLGNKYDKFKSGEYVPDRFIDHSNKTISLDELKSIEK